MDEIKNLLPSVKNPPNEELTPIRSPTALRVRHEPSSPIYKLYLAQVMRIVSKAISLANAPSLAEAELGTRARDWTEVLIDIVPEERLLESFNQAAKDHRSSFPIDCVGIKLAYEKIVVAERAEARAAHERFLDKLDDERKFNDRYECQSCFNSGFREVPDPRGGIYKGVVRCYECRYWEFNQKRLAAR